MSCIYEGEKTIWKIYCKLKKKWIHCLTCESCKDKEMKKDE